MIIERYYFVLYDGALTLKMSKMALNSFCDKTLHLQQAKVLHNYDSGRESAIKYMPLYRKYSHEMTRAASSISFNVQPQYTNIYIFFFNREGQFEFYINNGQSLWNIV